MVRPPPIVTSKHPQNENRRYGPDMKYILQTNSKNVLTIFMLNLSKWWFGIRLSSKCLVFAIRTLAFQRDGEVEMRVEVD